MNKNTIGLSFERLWLDGRLAAPLFWALAVLLCCAAVWLGFSFSGLKDDLRVAEQARQDSFLLHSPPEKRSSDAAELDFTAAFKDVEDSTALLRELAGFAEASAVQMTTLALSHRGASPNSLGRLDLSLALQSQYPSLLLFLRKVQQRYPQVSLEQLQMKRGTQTGQLDAAVTLVFWGRSSMPDSSQGGS